MKQISVIIPVYNAEKYIERSVHSALIQSQVAEVIIVNDGSTDNTFSICNDLAKNENKVKIFQHQDYKNHGAGLSRNLGIQKAQNDLIAFLDADDYYLPNRFDTALETFAINTDADGIYECLGIEFENQLVEINWNKRFSHQFTTLKEKITPKKLFFEMAPIGKKGWFSGDALLVKKTIFEKCGYFSTLKLSQDTELFLKMAITSNLYPGEISKPIAIRFVHTQNRITSSAEINYINRIQLWIQLLHWSIEHKINRKYRIAFVKQYVKTILICLRFRDGVFQKLQFLIIHMSKKILWNSLF